MPLRLQDGAAFGGTTGSDLQCTVFRRFTVVVRVEEGILESVGIWFKFKNRKAAWKEIKGKLWASNRSSVGDHPSGSS